MRVAIVGAGLAGLSAARELALAGHDVAIFEKSRGAGGRTSTRRSPHGRFDHGAPFLHDDGDPLALDAAPALALHAIADEDGDDRSPRSSTVARRTWEELQTVGAPAGNAPAKVLAEGLNVRVGIRVGAIVADDSGWSLADADGASLGSADAVVVCAPAPQAVELLPDPDLAARAASVTFSPCWVVMAAWEGPLGLPFTSARSTGGLAWAVAESPKPGRELGERWVLQADTKLSITLLEEDADRVTSELFARFVAATGTELSDPVHLAAHRWRYARPLTPLAEPFLRAGTLLAAGDWCGGTDAGAALRSGRAAAASLLDA